MWLTSRRDGKRVNVNATPRCDQGGTGGIRITPGYSAGW